MSWYLEALKKYAVFSGRARRKEYWMFVLLSGTLPVGTNPYGVAFDGSSIWVSNASGSSLSKL